MRHNKKRGMKLGTDASHTKAMKKSLVLALLKNDRIKTLDARAKAIRPDVDKVITWAKKGDAQGMWADRNGGYTRIMKLGPRKGDAAEVVVMELVTEAVQPKAKATKVSKVEAAPVEEPKAEEPAAEEAPAEESAE